MLNLCCGLALRKALKVLAAISGIFSLCGIATWGWSIYNVLVLANARHHIRLAILRHIDEELEMVFDKYVPGPNGNKGVVSLEVPEHEMTPVFKGAVIILAILAWLNIAQIIHLFLAIWLYSAANSKNQDGVKAWFTWTVCLFLLTLSACVAQMILVTFHGLSLAVIGVYLLFYFYALLVAKQFQNQEQERASRQPLETKSKERGVIYQKLRTGARVVLIEMGTMLV